MAPSQRTLSQQFNIIRLPAFYKALAGRGIKYTDEANAAANKALTDAGWQWNGKNWIAPCGGVL